MAIVLGAAGVTSVTQQKIGQADAKYRGMPKGDHHCDGCVN
jgi:hypothetical protein